MKYLFILIAPISTSFSFGQTLKQEIDNIYNFKPSQLSDEERKSKMPALDNLWERVKKDTTLLLPQLRVELISDGHNPFFYYDGSGLLLSLTNSKKDKELAIQSITKSDLDDISQKVYVKTLNALAHEGLDVTDAAIKILYPDNFSFFIPQHTITFNQGYCLTYMLLPQPNTNYVEKLKSMFSSLKPTGQKSIITTLWFTYSCEGDKFLNSILSNKTFDDEVRRYAAKIMEYKPLTSDQKQFIKSMGRDELENMRKNALKRFSDEAIEELDIITRVERKERECR